eukprot:GHVU01203681.1.p1 GENE.GHVU01203681.1~~GHVU01203681.1.p1  ORF type:complete len:111 (+),score=10.71 GHVU01203681.1:2-334(+)
MLLSAMTLYLFSEMWQLCQTSTLKKYNIAKGMQKLFPFTRTFDVNLTHILLFALIICMLSMRPDFEAEAIAKDGKSSGKRKDKTEATPLDTDGESRTPGKEGGRKGVKSS